MIDTWKQHIGQLAMQRGIINDPQWLDRLDDSMPVWAVLELMLQFSEKMEPKTNSYD